MSQELFPYGNTVENHGDGLTHCETVMPDYDLLACCIIFPTCSSQVKSIFYVLACVIPIYFLPNAQSHSSSVYTLLNCFDIIFCDVAIIETQ